MEPQTATQLGSLTVRQKEQQRVMQWGLSTVLLMEPQMATLSVLWTVQQREQLKGTQ